MGYSYNPANQPQQANAWWTTPAGPTASWQPPNENRWWSHASPTPPAWAMPATNTQHWGEPRVQWMHPGAGCSHPVHQLAVMAYPCQQHPPQQQGHLGQAQPPVTQQNEQDTVLKSIQQATDRIAQLETAIKAQTQRQEQQEEVIHDSVAMQLYVSQQIADWHIWRESEEYQLTQKSNKPEAAHTPPQQAGQTGHKPQQQGREKLRCGHLSRNFWRIQHKTQR